MPRIAARYYPLLIVVPFTAIALTSCSSGAKEIEVIAASPLPTATAVSIAPAPISTPVFTPKTPLLTSDQIKSEIDKDAADFMQRAGDPGLAVVVEERDPSAPNGLKTTFYDYGVRSTATKVPIGQDTVFEIGSISKVFTGIVLAALDQKHVLQLTDPLQQYVPAGTTVPTFNDVPIKLVNLGTHTAGLPKNPTDDDTFVNHAHPNLPAGDFPAQQLYDYLSTYKLTYVPGSKADYSNIGFALLGLAEAKAGGAPWGDLVQREISGPLNLPDTVLHLSAEQKQRVAQGYANGKPQPPFTDQDAYVATASLHSTPQDMALFLADNMRPATTPIQAALVEAQTPQVSVGFVQNTREGLGWDVGFPGQPLARVTKDGATTGFTSFIFLEPSAPYGFVLLSNSNDSMEMISFAGVLERYFTMASR